MKTATATGSKRGGSLTLDDKAGLSDDLRQMKDGGIILTVTLATPEAIRSTKFNRYYWGCVLKRIADAAEGNTAEDIHDAMCARFLSRLVFIVNHQTGEVEETTVAERSSKLPPDRFERFVMEVREFGQVFFGITIPDPDPNWRWKESAESAA